MKTIYTTTATMILGTVLMIGVPACAEDAMVGMDSNVPMDHIDNAAAPTEAKKLASEKASDGTHGRTILYWKAPMDPNFRSDKPGKSPMGMDLIPVYKDEVQSAGTAIEGRQPLTINPQQRQLLGVRTQIVKDDLLERTLRTVAIVKPEEERIFHIHSRVSGWIGKVYRRNIGDPVHAGDLLYDLYSPDLVATQTELLDAIVKADSRSSRLIRERLRLFNVSDREIERILALREPATTLKFYAPRSGFIAKAGAIDGLAVQPNDHLYDIVDLSQVRVVAHLYEPEISLIRVGQSARVDLENGEVLWGKVAYIYPFVEDKTRTVKVRFGFANSEGKLRPEGFADVTISVDLGAGPVLPKSAILFSGERQIAFVDKGDGVFEPRELTLGAEGDDGYLVQSGVAVGEAVVTSANFLIDSESGLRDALLNFGGKGSGQSSPPSPHAGH